MTSVNKLPIKITFFGDSIFTGQGVSIYNGWVTRIAKFLEDFSKDIPYSFLVSNSSVNGRTTRNALEDMQYHVLSQKVDILVLQFGLNDCNYWETDNGFPRVSKNAFIANMQEVIEKAQHAGVKKILLNNNHPTSRNKDIIAGTQTTFEGSNHEYSKAITEIVPSLNSIVKFQNIHEQFGQVILNSKNSIEKYLLDDGLHLNDSGHDIYYNIMQPILVKSIEELISKLK